jgi:regulation of enolase protein 1 (concanavalin A-like superfamily)
MLTFGCMDVGPNPVTLTVTDNRGKSSTCDAIIDVQDNTPPTAACQNITVQLDDSGQASIIASAIDDNSSDVCGIASRSVSPNSFGCGNTGPNTVTLTVTDNNGNSNTCNATVTVQDNNAPTAVCANTTVNLASDGITTVAASFFDGGSSAVCGGLDFSASVTDFDCDDVGSTYIITLTVTSQSSGESTTCTANVTVDDPNSFCCAPPMAQCDNITVQLDANGQASITPADIGGSSTAECGLQSESLSVSTFGCANVGSSNAVTYTITDVNNDSDNCTAIVTVEDNTAPTAACLNTTVELQPDGMYHLQQSDIYDAANSSDNCAIASVSFPTTTFGCDDVGLTFPVTLTVTDPSGNSDNCTANVSVEQGDGLPPGWSANDIGDQGAGSSYAYGPCARNNPNRGDFTISTGGYNLIPNNSDNLAFMGRELCNNGGIQARIEDVNGGYAGLMIRESSAPGAKMVAVYSNLTSLLRREVRTVDNGPRTSGTLFAPFPYWLRLVRQNNYIRAFYRTSDNGSWTLFHQAYLPMKECVEMGLAVFTTDPNGQAEATFSRVQWQSNVGGSSLAIFNEGPIAAQPEERDISVFPNPARSAFTLAFSRALESGGIAILRNQMGQAVAQRQLQAGEVNVDWDVSGLPGGLYLIEVRQEGWPPEVLRIIKTE